MLRENYAPSIKYKNNKKETRNRDEMKIKKIDISRKISDNPFDVLSSSLYKQDRKNRENKPEPRSDHLKDDAFKEILMKSKVETRQTRKDTPYGIFTGMKILTGTEVKIEPKRMYKFPFELDTKNDGSQLFRSLYSEYLVAIKSVFKEYKKSKFEFYLKFGNDFLHFGSILKITTGMKRILIANEIKFKEDDYFLIVEGMEIALVFDYIINLPLSPSFVLPFLLSEDQFDNSISFSIELHKGPIVKKGSEILYSYRLAGPFWIEDYRILVDCNNSLF